jgi:acetoin utilization deacetylase AcuC-like enzyme
MSGDPRRPGLVHDPVFLEHDLAIHPERAARLEAVAAELTRTGLVSRFTRVAPRAATREELTSIHTARYVDEVARASAAEAHLDPDTYTNRRSFAVASLAAGGVADLVLAVCRGDLPSGLALPRPPGHHARRDRAMGFCLFGNVALAARTARDRGGMGRVAVVDYDVHHGNGTQEIVERDPGILYVSAHQYPYYPGTGAEHETGRGTGAGTLVNVPLPAGTGDAGLRRVLDRIVEPCLRRFAPDLILVSAGFDGHWRDPLAGLRYSLTALDEAARRLLALARELCGGRLVFVLEGGYDLEVLAGGVANLGRALLDDPAAPDPAGPAAGPEPDVEPVIAVVRRRHGLWIPAAPN